MSKIDLDHFEKIFMYKCITDEEYFTTIVDVTNVDYLKYSENKLIFNIIKDFFSKRSALPTLTELKTYITTKDEISAFKFILNIVQTLDKTFNKDELIENTERFLKERAVYNTILEVADSIHTGEFDTSLILDKFEKNCNISLISDSGIEIYSNIDNVIADLNNTEPVISSKWKWLDDKLEGGFLQNGRGLYIFAGQTNIGKSIVLGNIAKNIAETGKTVLLITLEMSEMMYAKRICSSVSKIPIRELRTNCRLLKETITDIKNKNPKGRIFIKEFPPSLITPNQLSAFIKKLKSKGINIDAIVLDYLNLLNSPVGSNSYERVKYLSEQVRALTYVFSCPIITATQINRSEYDVGEPSLKSLSESYGMGATADFIAGVYQQDEDSENGIIRMGIMKNRFGPNFGNNAFSIDYSTLNIIEDEELNSLTTEAEDSLNTLNLLQD